MTDRTRREAIIGLGILLAPLQTDWGWDWPPWGDDDDDLGNGDGQRIYVTDDSGEDPTDEDGDVVFYV